MRRIRCIALAGGVGGAKLAFGLQAVLGEELMVVVNTGDDFEHLGLQIAPDVDTVCYTLAGLNDSKRGWGRADESWNAMNVFGALGAETWFQLGDRDLALHILRTHALREGVKLGAFTAMIAERLAIAAEIVPMSDDPVSTRIETSLGLLAFQDYFVRKKCEPTAQSIAYHGAGNARVPDRLSVALEADDLNAIIICPSNPLLSIAPILAIPGLRDALCRAEVPIIAVSPLIQGTAIKGPAAKLMTELGLGASAVSVARYYRDLLDGFVLDTADTASKAEVVALGTHPHHCNTIMRDGRDMEALAVEVLEFAKQLAGSPSDERPR